MSYKIKLPSQQNKQTLIFTTRNIFFYKNSLENRRKLIHDAHKFPVILLLENFNGMSDGNIEEGINKEKNITEKCEKAVTKCKEIKE